MSANLAAKSSFEMTRAEQERYARDGYIVREAVFSRGECDLIAKDCEALIEELGAIEPTRRIKTGTFTFDWLEERDTTVKWERGVEGRKVRGLEFFAHLSPAIMAWAMDARMTDPCKAACDARDVVLFTEKLNMKRAEMGGPVELHQDFPYWVDFAPHAGRVVTAMLFLDDATLENGCLQVAPGSHRDGRRPNRTDAAGLDLLQMDTSQFDLNQLVPLEVPAGSVVFFGSYLVHCSSPNRSNKDRRALLYSYQPAEYAHARDLMRAQRDAEKS